MHYFSFDTKIKSCQLTDTRLERTPDGGMNSAKTEVKQQIRAMFGWKVMKHASLFDDLMQTTPRGLSDVHAGAWGWTGC